MKEDWKVYIKGVQERGDEVIKALEERGASNSHNFSCGDDNNLLFYINHNGTIDITDIGTEKSRIIMDNYHELHLSEQQKDSDWKDGDILIRKDNNNLFCVYQRHVDTCSGKGFLCHVYVSKDTLFNEVTIPLEAANNYRKATDAEKSTFYSLIDNHYMHWNAENKQLVDYRPKDKEELPQWEDGDILIRTDRIKENEYTVFRKYSHNSMFYNYDFLISIDIENHLRSRISGEEHLYKTENFRLATSEEIKQFYSLLHKMDKDWDSEKKHLVKLKKEPTLNIIIIG